MTDRKGVQPIDWEKVHTLIQQRRGPEIAPHLEEYLQAVPDDVNAQVALGLAAWTEGDIQTAHTWLRRAVETDPHHVEAVQHLNRLRVRESAALPNDRPKILCNAYGGRIGQAIASVADTIFFVRGEQLGRREEVIAYDIREHGFELIYSQLPAGWAPDFILFHLTEVEPLPSGIEDAAAVTVAIPGDCFPLQKLSIDLNLFDVVLPGIRRYKPVFEALGHPQVVYGGGGAVQGVIPSLGIVPPEEGDRPYDVLFIGNVGLPYYERRTRYVERLLRLGDRFNVFASTKGLSSEEYFRLLAQSKIVIEAPSIQGGVNMRSFEAPQFGALLMHEKLDHSIEEFYAAGEEVVLYDEENFEELIEYYLSNEAERQRIALRAHEKAVSRFTMHGMAREALRVLTESGLQRRTRKEVHRWSEEVKWSCLARSDYYATEYGRALVQLEQAVRLNPQEPAHFNDLGVATYAVATVQKRPELKNQAYTWLRKALDTNPSYWLAQYNALRIGCEDGWDEPEILFAAKRLIVALSDFIEKPRQEAAGNLQGLCVFPEVIRDPRLPVLPYEAIAWERAVERFPKRDVDYLVELARVLLGKTLEMYADAAGRTGRTTEAAEALLEALGLNSEHAGRWMRLGERFLELDKPEEAVECFENSLSILPLNVDAEVALAKALMRLGRVETAQERVEIFERTNILAPERNGELRAALGEKNEPPSPLNRASQATARFDPSAVIDQFEKQNPGAAIFSDPRWPEFRDEFVRYFSAFPDSSEAQEFREVLLRPVLNGKTPNTHLDKFYFYQDTWAARRVFQVRPDSVVDVGSTALYAGILSQFVPTTFVDIRPIEVDLPGLEVRCASILDLPFEDASQEMVTSLCVVEHIGLGRYGDPIQPDGTRLACRELARIVRPGGHLVVSVPVGPPAIVFNAHRIFSREQILGYFSDCVVVEEAFFFPEAGGRERLQELRPGQFAFYTFLLRKEDRGG